jgi:hypothetical protein
MLHISDVKYKNLLHKVQFINVHVHMIQLKGDL